MLFILIFFSSLGTVSLHLTNSQLTMLKKKSEAEYATISNSLAKDLAVLSGKNSDSETFLEDIHVLANNYKIYYQKNNILLYIEHRLGASNPNQLYFDEQDGKNMIRISAPLSGAFGNYHLNYSCDITQNIVELSHVQNILLLIAVAFSIVTAVALYVILTGIFKPLAVVSQASRKIAAGHYDERISIKGKNELASMAADYNRMAAEIEKQILLLADEAAQKQHFVDNFAHEIRTPLTSVYGYAEYMQKARLGEEEIIESAQLILNEAAYMRKISDSLLALTMLRQSPAKKSLSCCRVCSMTSRRACGSL